MPRARLGTLQQQRKKTTRSIPWKAQRLLGAADYLKAIRMDAWSRRRLTSVLVDGAGALYDLQQEINQLRVKLAAKRKRGVK